MMNAFAIAHRMLSSITRTHRTSDNAEPPIEYDDFTREAKRLLVALGYAQNVATEETGIRSTSHDRGVVKNRLALLHLASHFDQAFQLPLPYAPGAFFFGAMLSPSAYGIDTHVKTSTGVAGRGTSLQRAFESCAGEAAEYLSFLERKDDALPSRQISDHGLSQVVMEWSLGGLGLSKLPDPGTVDWIEAVRLHDSAKVAFPAELVLRRDPARRIAKSKAESTGLGAGPSMADAKFSGLMEVIERDAVALWWYGGRPARRIGNRLRDETGFSAFVSDIRSGTERRTWLLDLTTDLSIPVVAALSADEDGHAVVGGFCAHPDIGFAMRGASLELCQMELAQQLAVMKLDQFGEKGLNDQDLVWVARNRHLSIDAYPELMGCEETSRRCGGGSEPHLECKEALAGSGFDPYLVDLTRPEIGIPVAKVVVPGLQSINPAWRSRRLDAMANNTRTPLDKAAKKISLI